MTVTEIGILKRLMRRPCLAAYFIPEALRRVEAEGLVEDLPDHEKPHSPKLRWVKITSKGIEAIERAS